MKCECWSTVEEKEIKLNLLYDPTKLTLYILRGYGIDEELEQSVHLGYYISQSDEDYVFNFNKNSGNIIQYYKRNSKGAIVFSKALKWKEVRKIISESPVYKTDSNGYLYNENTSELLLCPYNEDKILTLETIPFKSAANCFDKAEEIICTRTANIGLSPNTVPAVICTAYSNCEVLRIPNNTQYPFFCWKSCFPKLKKMIFNGKLKMDNDRILEDAKTAGFDENSDLEIIQEFYIDRTGKPIKNEG